VASWSTTETSRSPTVRYHDTFVKLEDAWLFAEVTSPCSGIRRCAEMLVDELHGHRALAHCGRAALGRA
ncbi:MAG TPA: hypothetical protein VNO53_10715, partial [Steroidobacteraceae bacterium]|nr:hypothetical protein [Steroidobacteraceae bacterium]